MTPAPANSSTTIWASIQNLRLTSSLKRLTLRILIKNTVPRWWPQRLSDRDGRVRKVGLDDVLVWDGRNPSWQSVLGNPAEGVRDPPESRYIAAGGLWSHFTFVVGYRAWRSCPCGPRSGRMVRRGGGHLFCFAIMAGIQALINQKAGGPQGNPAPVYYQLARRRNMVTLAAVPANRTVATRRRPVHFLSGHSGDMNWLCRPNVTLAGGSVGVL